MILKAKIRETLGKKVKSLRVDGFVPASIYGAKRNPSVAISIDAKEAKKAFEKNGYSNIIEVEVEGEKKTVQVVFKEIQIHPVKGEITHISFHQIEMDKEITAEIPLSFIGTAMAVKNNLGLLITVMESIMVSCLPKNLPSKIEIDLSKLDNVGDSVTLDNIQLPEGVEIGHGTPKDAVLAYISAPQKAEEEAPAENADSATSAPTEAKA